MRAHAARWIECHDADLIGARAAMLLETCAERALIAPRDNRVHNAIAAPFREIVFVEAERGKKLCIAIRLLRGRQSAIVYQRSLLCGGPRENLEPALLFGIPICAQTPRTNG